MSPSWEAPCAAGRGLGADSLAPEAQGLRVSHFAGASEAALRCVTPGAAALVVQMSPTSKHARLTPSFSPDGAVTELGCAGGSPAGPRERVWGPGLCGASSRPGPRPGEGRWSGHRSLTPHSLPAPVHLPAFSLLLEVLFSPSGPKLVDVTVGSSSPAGGVQVLQASAQPAMPGPDVSGSSGGVGASGCPVLLGASGVLRTCAQQLNGE